MGVSKGSEISNQVIESTVSESPFRKRVDTSFGIVTLGPNYSEADSMIDIENEDGSRWHQFSFYYDDSDGKYDFAREDFHPYHLDPDYSGLGFECLSETEDSYKVVVDMTWSSNSGH
ncbi:MAG: hypothetical protein R2684_04565 [Pyrinomonadaceae bacterium]